MSSISTTPLHISISDFQNIDRSIASISGVILEARSYQKALNPKGNEVYGAAYPISNAPVYLADTESHTLRAIDLSTDPPTLQLIAGTGRQGDGPDGDPLKCRMTRLHGVGLDPETGLVFIGDSGAHRVRVLRPRK